MSDDLGWSSKGDRVHLAEMLFNASIEVENILAIPDRPASEVLGLVSRLKSIVNEIHDHFFEETMRE